MARTIKLSVHDKVKVSDSAQAFFDSNYFIVSNQNKCKIILLKKEKSAEDIIDALIALHLALETGLNILYRDIALLSLKKNVDRFEVIENIDRIDFISKTIMFIYNSSFDFQGKIIDADKYHSIINTLKDFAKTRNQLLHGHSISTLVTSSGEVKESNLRKSLTEEFLDNQIAKFLFIMEGMHFYIDCLKLHDLNKEHYKINFLNTDFITVE